MDERRVADNTPGVRRVLIYTLILNETVAGLKIIFGYLTGSIAILSDGFHSLFDGVSNLLGLVGIRLASHPPDKEHPYGHKKVESVLTAIIAFMVFATCLQILWRSYRAVSDHHEIIVNIWSFGVMVVTMFVNIVVMTYEKRKGRELGSDFLIADALHTKSDMLTSSAVIAGLIFVKAGYVHADAIAGIVVALFIARIGYEILKDVCDILMDKAQMDADKICNLVKGIEAVIDCHGIRTRGTRHYVFLDLHVLVDPNMTILRAHEIADMVEERIKKAFPEVADIVVHTEPFVAGISGGKDDKSGN